MTQKRFDLASLSSLKSRDGSVAKGALQRNGFNERDGAGERWSNMRPALANGEVAPFSGSSLGLGLINLGTYLYGLYAQGVGSTATSFVIDPRPHSQTGFALQLYPVTGEVYQYNAGGNGTLIPSTYTVAGTSVTTYFCGAISVTNPSGTGTSPLTQVQLEIVPIGGSAGQNAFHYIQIGTSSRFYTAQAYAYSYLAPQNVWYWTNAAVSSAGTYTGTLSF